MKRLQDNCGSMGLPIILERRGVVRGRRESKRWGASERKCSLEH